MNIVEEGLHYQGPFWIIADSVKNIHRNNFYLVGDTYPCNYNGEYIDNTTSKSQKTHKKLWEKLKENYGNVEFTYYPRGRVAICDGTAFIHINSKCNIPGVIDSIVNMYHIGKLELEIDLNDVYQGSHYDFQLS